jgi:hypothetical protein
MTQPTHPGTITYIDNSNPSEAKTVKVEEVPESLRFAPTENGLVPVVKVVAYTEGNQRIIREHGPDGAVVRSTVQFRNPA